ncbi:unnamed protein product [Caenorhabditis auriculariae]|uniref:Uncharacterized protein n=1 Tax=Caenorhabditis auriculariae TaxID=2777116 RepID=A0A8S1HWY9_9PELO|nr:unnamed protein product [Caenorhabditis auriculariae]
MTARRRLGYASMVARRASILEWGLTLTLFCKTPEGVVQRIEVWQMGLGPLLRQLGCVCWSTVFLEHPGTSIEVLLSPGEEVSSSKSPKCRLPC